MVFLTIATVAGFVAHMSETAAGYVILALYLLVLADNVSDREPDRRISMAHCAGEALVTFVPAVLFGVLVGMFLAHMILGSPIPDGEPGACSYTAHCL